MLGQGPRDDSYPDAMINYAGIEDLRKAQIIAELSFEKLPKFQILALRHFRNSLIPHRASFRTRVNYARASFHPRLAFDSNATFSLNTSHYVTERLLKVNFLNKKRLGRSERLLKFRSSPVAACQIIYLNSAWKMIKN